MEKNFISTITGLIKIVSQLHKPGYAMKYGMDQEV